MLGQPLPPLRPHLALAQQAGRVSPEQVSIIERALASVDGRGFDPADIEVGEQIRSSTRTRCRSKTSEFLPNR